MHEYDPKEVNGIWNRIADHRESIACHYPLFVLDLAL
jgi:hypothetical protein